MNKFQNALDWAERIAAVVAITAPVLRDAASKLGAGKNLEDHDEESEEE